MVRGFLGVTMKILNHGAMTGSAVRDFPELTLAAAFREAGTDYGHGSYAAYVFWLCGLRADHPFIARSDWARMGACFGC